MSGKTKAQLEEENATLRKAVESQSDSSDGMHSFAANVVRLKNELQEREEQLEEKDELIARLRSGVGKSIAMLQEDVDRIQTLQERLGEAVETAVYFRRKYETLLEMVKEKGFSPELRLVRKEQ